MQIGIFLKKINDFQIIFAQVQVKLGFWKEGGPHLKDFSMVTLSSVKYFTVHNPALEWNKWPRFYTQNKKESRPILHFSWDLHSL